MICSVSINCCCEALFQTQQSIVPQYASSHHNKAVLRYKPTHGSNQRQLYTVKIKCLTVEILCMNDATLLRSVFDH